MVHRCIASKKKSIKRLGKNMDQLRILKINQKNSRLLIKLILRFFQVVFAKVRFPKLKDTFNVNNVKKSTI